MLLMNSSFMKQVMDSWSDFSIYSKLCKYSVFPWETYFLSSILCTGFCSLGEKYSALIKPRRLPLCIVTRVWQVLRNRDLYKWAALLRTISGTSVENGLSPAHKRSPCSSSTAERLSPQLHFNQDLLLGAKLFFLTMPEARPGKLHISE